MDVAELRGGLVGNRDKDAVFLRIPVLNGFHGRFSAVEQVEQKGLSLDVGHVDVLYPDIPDHAAASPLALEAEADVGSQKAASPDHHVLNPAGHLAAHYKSSVAVIHHAVLNHQVLAGNSPAAAISVLSGLDADAVVTAVKAGIHQDGTGA